MDASMEGLLETYLFETNSLLDGLDELLINAEKIGDFSEDDVNEIFRSMHTIKGSSAMLEFNFLMEIAHHIEDLFFYIRENGIDSLDQAHKSELFNLMFKSTDKLRSEIEKVENNEPLETNIDSFVAEINGLLDKISGKVSDSPEDKAPEKASAGTESVPLNPDDAPHYIHVFFEDGCGMENLRAFMIVNALQERELEFIYYPNDIDSNPDSAEKIIEQGFYLGFRTADAREQAVRAIDQAQNIRSYETGERVEEPAEPEPEQQPASPAETAPAAANTAAAAPKAKSEAPAAKKKEAAPHGAVKQDLISVNLSKLDALMALVGEIVITESMVTSSPDLQGLSLDNFNKSARQLRKLTDDLQDISMSLRMVSVSGVFQKMNRIVRDMKQNLNRDVRLTIIGENTEVDKTIVDSIGDPLMHIVRNAIDHGIEENVQDRIAAGKDPQGEVILSAAHTGSEVIISVEDDGRGMDTDAILAKAARNGLLTKPESDYSQKEILSLLMMPGFSTNTEVTEYSGRGVGLDVVKKNVEAVGGIVSITSELGKGSCTTLKIPLTLAIADGMEISVGKSIFTIPISNIRQSFKATEEDIILDPSGHEMVRCMDEFYPVVRIGELYNIPDSCTKINDGILMWVEASDKSYCLFVDKLIGEHQVVVKPLPPYLQQFHIKDSGISGCSILGDGNITIILDVAHVYAAAQGIY
ncbi:MAG: chemotaxis protein CheA [Dorea sp.]|jgi:two-component system chemotaxis sensor kinase CheA|nr:chemotaxis protein CheA [Dorea sp.]MCI9247736.1 chemotaxis protein CheA [Dorea sp.]